MKNKKSCTRFFSFHSYMTLHSCAHNHMQQVNKWRITTSEQKSHNVYNVWHHNRFPIHSNISASHFKIVPTLRQLRGLLDCFIQCIANSRKRSVWPKVKNIHSFQPASWESYVFIRWHQSFLVQLSPPPPHLKCFIHPDLLRLTRVIHSTLSIYQAWGSYFLWALVKHLFLIYF